jgi:hypothetical protein
MSRMRIWLRPSCIPERLGALISVIGGWSPLHKHVRISIESADDEGLAGVERTGIIRAYDPATGALLIVLSQTLSFSDGESFDVVAAAPALHGHRPARLRVTRTVVRLVLASSFGDLGSKTSRTIGTGRLGICASREHPEGKEYKGTVVTQLVMLDSQGVQQTFILAPTTEISKGKAPLASANIQPGWRVRVQATTSADGTRVANRVIVQDTKRGDDDANDSQKTTGVPETPRRPH